MAAAAQWAQWVDWMDPVGATRAPTERARGASGSDLERRLAGLARSRGPLRRALAALAERLIATKSWERLGFARLADYARERLGLSARELQDLARVDRALRELPQLEAALVAGSVPWTQVRLLARAARTEDEATWLAFAKRVSTRELARAVRAVDAGSVEAGAAEAEEDDEGQRQTVVVRCTPAVHAQWQFAWRLARRVAGEALPVGECMEAIAAEVLSALPLEGEVEAEAESPPGEAARPPPGRSAEERLAARRWQRWERTDGCPEALRRLLDRPEPGTPERDGSPPPVALPRFLRPLVEGLESADAFALDARLRRAVAHEQRLEATMGPLLLRVAEHCLYRLRGYAGLDAYASERLGLSPRKARALLRVERAARTCPALREAYREGHLSWVKAQALVATIALTPLHARAWIAFARRVTVRRLRDDLDRALLRAERDPQAFARHSGIPNLESEGRLQTGAQSRDSEKTPSDPNSETSRFFFNAPKDVARLFRATLCTVRRRLARQGGHLPSEGEAVGAMFDHVFATWGARDPATAKRHRIFERDGWRCTTPGCTSYRGLHCHHVTYRSRGGGEEPQNKTTLCLFHHQYGVHAGVLRLTGRAPERLRFELGVRAGRPPLAVYEGREVLV